MDDQRSSEDERIYPLGTYKCKEDYEHTAKHIGPMLDQLKELNEKLEPYTDSRITWYFGGDLKNILLVRGLPDAKNHGKNCPYCECDFVGRRDLSKVWDVDPDRPAGPRKDLVSWIPVENTIIDPLHLMLRVFDKLWQRLWKDLQVDVKSMSALLRRVKRVTGMKLRKMKDGKTYKLPLQLTASERWTILANVDMEELWPENLKKARWLQGLYRRFSAFYSEFINSFPPDNKIERKRWLDKQKGLYSKWIEDLTSLDEDNVAGRQNGRFGESIKTVRVEKGYNTSLMTCYMHLLHSHVEEIIFYHQAVGGMRVASMQGFERLNNRDGKHYKRCNSKRKSEEVMAMFLNRVRIIFSKATRKAHVSCPKCDKRYETVKWLKSHMRKKHDMEWVLGETVCLMVLVGIGFGG